MSYALAPSEPLLPGAPSSPGGPGGPAGPGGPTNCVDTTGAMNMSSSTLYRISSRIFKSAKFDVPADFAKYEVFSICDPEVLANAGEPLKGITCRLFVIVLYIVSAVFVHYV
jgi:hypothetical protein